MAHRLHPRGPDGQSSGHVQTGTFDYLVVVLLLLFWSMFTTSSWWCLPVWFLKSFQKHLPSHAYQGHTRQVKYAAPGKGVYWCPGVEAGVLACNPSQLWLWWMVLWALSYLIYLHCPSQRSLRALTSLESPWRHSGRPLSRQLFW